MSFEQYQRSLSNALGATSVTCWLFAQFPQVIENYRRGSCKGLALPFLVNWLLGDFTNLIGCIFTDQLPFQTYLALYFCIIDFMLILQYFHYTRKDKQLLRHGTGATGSRYRHRHPQQHQHQHYQHQYHSQPQPQSQRASAIIAGSQQQLQQQQQQTRHLHDAADNNPIRPPRSGSGSQDTGRYTRPAIGGRSNTMTASMIGGGLTQVTSDITRTQSASKVRDIGHSPRIIGHTPTLHNDQQYAHQGHRRSSNPSDSSDAEDGTAAAEMYESMQSKRSDKSTSTLGSLRRGRSTVRSQQHGPRQERQTPSHPALGEQQVAVEVPRDERQQHRQVSGSRHRQSTDKREPSVPSRVRSVVFLSLWTFCGLAGLWSRSVTPTMSRYSDSTVTPQPEVWTQSLSMVNSTEHHISLPRDLPDVEPPPIDYSLVIGRVSAWICVCFYLTSRMPQIWKNFQRRSVEGLSILLFASAFAGNLFYVMSVLTSPLIQQDEGYLFESIPFLLGSGGTLAFDVTIMVQACLYRGLSPRRYEKQAQLHDDEEGAALLGSQDALYISGGTESRVTHSGNSRKRSTSDSLRQ